MYEGLSEGKDAEDGDARGRSRRGSVCSAAGQWTVSCTDPNRNTPGHKVLLPENLSML